MTNGGAEGEMELRSVTDSMLLQQWLEGCIEFEHFWDSKPRWAPSSGRRLVSDELVVWSERSLFSVSPAAAAVAIHFDGNLTLAALVDDVVAAVDAAGGCGSAPGCDGESRVVRTWCSARYVGAGSTTSSGS